MKKNLLILFALLTVLGYGGATDSPWLYGIHWYGDTGASDVESMSGGKNIWVLETTFTNPVSGNPWEASNQKYWLIKPITDKGHSLIIRIHPDWGRNVPHSSDPFTLTDHANGCKTIANDYKDIAHVFIIGNEVNITEENKRYNTSTLKYDIIWQPTPEQYADVYVQCRDKIHEVTPTTNPASQLVLMQPVSPGSAEGIRYMDGNEFLWRQIAAVSDKSKIDGFAIHGYAGFDTSDYGVGEYMDTLREQLMIIDSFGLGDRPIFVTEWAKGMGDANAARIGAKFIYNALSQMNAWNSGIGGELPGRANHVITATTWFVYPTDATWNSYSLLYWKSNVTPLDKDNNPWYAYQYACGLNYAKGNNTYIPPIPQNTIWWQENFDGASLDTSSPLPDWKAVTGAGGTVAVQNGYLRLIGYNQVNNTAGIRSTGYVFGDFSLNMEVLFANPNRANTTVGEANFDLRFREGSKGYSITFFTKYSPANTNKIILRRTNDWTTIGSFESAVTIDTNDKFNIDINANGSSIKIKIFKNDGTSPVVDWNVSDTGQNVGWIMPMIWNLGEAKINYIRMGGIGWSTVEDWKEN